MKLTHAKKNHFRIFPFHKHMSSAFNGLTPIYSTFDRVPLSSHYLTITSPVPTLIVTITITLPFILSIPSQLYCYPSVILPF